MAGLRGFADLGFVDLDAEAGLSEEMHKTVAVIEHRRVHEIVEQVAALVVMNAERLFLDEGIRRAEIDLQTRGETNRTERTMRRDRHIESLRHRRDLLQFADPAGVRAVRLDDVRATALQ